MTTSIPQPGELWTVPAAGPGAYVLVLSEVGKASNGAPDFQGIGVRLGAVDRSRGFVDELLIAAEETAGAQPLTVELWNLRPLLVEQLGARVEQVLAALAFDAVWDAILRMADASVEVDPARLGVQVPGPELIARRHEALTRWHALSMNGCLVSRRIELDLSQLTAFTRADQEELDAQLEVDARHSVPVRAGRARVLAASPVVAPRITGALMPSARARGTGRGRAKVLVFSGVRTVQELHLGVVGQRLLSAGYHHGGTRAIGQACFQVTQ